MELTTTKPIPEETNAQEQTATTAEPITLRTPITFEGRRVTALTPDFDRLNGDALIYAESAFIKEGGSGGSVMELNKGYLSYVAAIACDEPVELIRALKAQDFTLLTLRVSNFLLD